MFCYIITSKFEADLAIRIRAVDTAIRCISTRLKIESALVQVMLNHTDIQGWEMGCRLLESVVRLYLAYTLGI